MNEEEHQQLLEEINYYQQLLNQVEKSLVNLKKTRDDLLEFEKEESKKVLAPIANGVYVEASIKKKDLFVNVGSGVVVKKSIVEAVDIINKQEKDLLLDQSKLIEKIELCYVLMKNRG